MHRFEERCAASASAAWGLYADPDRWHEWAPHLRGSWGLGHGEVRQGARGAVRLLGAIPVPVLILAVDPPRCWSWQVGPVTMAHRVEPAGRDGCTVALELSARGPLEPLVAATYGPLIGLLLRRLAAAAAAAARG